MHPLQEVHPSEWRVELRWVINVMSFICMRRRHCLLCSYLWEERHQWPEIVFPVFAFFAPLSVCLSCSLCCSLALCLTFPSHPFCLVHFSFLPCLVFLTHARTSSRSDHLGADDIWRQTVRRHPHARNPRHSGERGASAPASHMHHRCLHGHGEMWENTQKHTYKCSNQNIPHTHSTLTNKRVYKIWFTGGRQHRTGTQTHFPDILLHLGRI